MDFKKINDDIEILFKNQNLEYATIMEGGREHDWFADVKIIIDGEELNIFYGKLIGKEQYQMVYTKYFRMDNKQVFPVQLVIYMAFKESLDYYVEQVDKFIEQVKIVK